MNKINYNKWSRAYKEMVSELDLNIAKQNHDNRKLYFVTFEKSGSPTSFLEINNTFILAGFLDKLKRDYLEYTFTEIEPGKLFLKEAQYWEYEESSDQKIFSTRYFFSPDGKLKIEKANLKTNEVETLTAKNTIDVSANYEKYPEFGKYDDLIKIERLDMQ